MTIYKPSKLIYSSVHIDRVNHFIRDHFHEYHYIRISVLTDPFLYLLPIVWRYGAGLMQAILQGFGSAFFCGSGSETLQYCRNFESVEEVVVVWDNGTAANYRCSG